MDAENVAAAPAQQEAEQAPAKPKSKLKKFGFYLCVLFSFIWVANILWVYSGDGQWKLERDEDGVQIYSKKHPGNYMVQFKGVMRGEYTLNQMVAGLIENSTLDNCKNNIPDCVDLKVIEPWSNTTRSDTVMWTLGLPEPFTTREILIQSFVNQDPETKIVTIDVIAAPNKIPRTPGTIRVEYMQNKWRYIPLDNGQVEIEFSQDMSMGGLMPDLLFNLGGADETYKFIHDQLPGLINKPEFKTIKYPFIEEK